MRARLIPTVIAVLAATSLAACGSGSPARKSTAAPTPTIASAPMSTPAITAPTTIPAPPSTTAVTPTHTRSHTRTPSRTPAPPTKTHTTPTPSIAPANGAPVIVIDPGHSRTINATDPDTGLNVSDYENEPEMQDMFAVAQLVRTALEARGYRVIMTKSYDDQPRSLLDRAQIARDAHADLALSIHDQAGSNGGIGFRAGNNIVYYQSVGTYRATSSGKRIYFTDAAVAHRSERYGNVFVTQRQRVEGTSVRLQGNTGYDLGGRGLAGGNIWMVQLLSGVPWIYNEAGGNSNGQSGLDAADRATYAAALVASVEHCIAPPH